MTDGAMTPREAVERLKAMTEETVYASDLAPILRINPGVIVEYVKNGKWDAGRLGNYVISGNRVKFYRRDFLQKGGFIPADPEVPTDRELLEQLLHTAQVLIDSNLGLIKLLKSIGEIQEEQGRLICLLTNEKPPAAATADG